VAAALVAICTFLPASAAAVSKTELLRTTATQVAATNGILNVQMDNTTGQFTITTGASHPHPNQTVFYPCCTSYMTLRDATALQMLVNLAPGGIAPGLSGYSIAQMTAPVVTNQGTTGVRATYTMANWTLVEDVTINGTTLNDTNVQVTTTVTNTTGAARQLGLRYMWDWEIAGNDGSFFRTRNPDGAFTGTPTTFVAPTFQLYEEVDNIATPTFSVFATNTGGPLSPAPTTPDQLRYSNWPTSVNSAWDYTDPGSTGDSSISYFWGFAAPITVNAGASQSFTQYVTTQFSAVATPVETAPAGIPTLSQWSLILLSVFAIGLGIWSVRRRTL
jgi:hypothetical protein